MKKLIISLILAATAISLPAKDIKTLTVTTNPIMHCSSCENKIKNNLRFERGIKKIETSVPEQRVTITYDADKNTAEKIIKAFEKIGYKASEINSDNSNKPAESEDCCKKKSECCKKSNGCCKKLSDNNKDCEVKPSQPSAL